MRLWVVEDNAFRHSGHQVLEVFVHFVNVIKLKKPLFISSFEVVSSVYD